MAKKSRPAFSAPSTSERKAPAPAWVYRSEPEPKPRVATRRPPAAAPAKLPGRTTRTARALPEGRSAGVVVSSLALLMYPCAAVAVFVGAPIERWWRTRGHVPSTAPHESA